MYSVIAIFTRIQDLVSPSIGLEVGLDFIPELISVLCFVAIGFMTRDVKRAVIKEEVVELRTRSQTSNAPMAGESGAGLKFNSV